MRKICYVIYIFSMITLTQAYESQSFTKNDLEPHGWYNSFLGYQYGDCNLEQQVVFKNVRSTIFKQFELPPHYKITINVKLWEYLLYLIRIYVLDVLQQPESTWRGEKLIGYLDHQQFDNQEFKQNRVTHKSEFGKCYPNDKDAKLYFYSYNNQFEFIHRANTAFVIFTTSAYKDYDTKFWGISDFKLTISECPEGCAFCYNQNQCDHWERIAFSLYQVSSKEFVQDLEEGWQSPYKKVVKCQGLYFFGMEYSNKKKNENEVKTFKVPKVKPHHHFRVQFLFAVLDYKKKNLKLQIQGKDKLFYQKTLIHKDSYYHDLCNQDEDAYQNFLRDGFISEHEIYLPESFTFKVNEGNTDLAPYVWGIRDFQIFVQYCPEDCLKCRDSTSCIECQDDYIWDHYKQSCVKDDYGYIENIRQFTSTYFTEIDGWTLRNNNYGTQVGKCQVSLVGGLDILGIYGRAARQFQLEVHERVRIILNIYLFGDWENQQININVDGKLQKSTKISPSLLKEKTCNQDQLIKTGILKNLIVDLAHTKEFIHIEIYSKIENYNSIASWGFRDFTIQTFQKFVCATLFTQIDYQGEETQICQSGNEKLLLSTDVKSIKVPSNSQIIMTTDTEEEISFLADTPCLEGKMFTSAQLSILQEQKDDKNDLQQETE